MILKYLKEVKTKYFKGQKLVQAWNINVINKRWTIIYWPHLVHLVEDLADVTAAMLE